MPVKKPRGRPSKFQQKLADEICQRLAQGEPYVKICQDAHMPVFSTIWRWEQSNPDFGRQAQGALEHGTHFLAHDCFRIADDDSIDAPHKKIIIHT